MNAETNENLVDAHFQCPQCGQIVLPVEVYQAFDYQQVRWIDKLLFPNNFVYAGPSDTEIDEFVGWECPRCLQKLVFDDRTPVPRNGILDYVRQHPVEEE